MRNKKRYSEDTVVRIPQPTPQFRRRAWQAFQKALDPLGPPRPPRRQH